MSKKEHPGFYAIIPASVRYDKSLCPNAKLLYGEITALTEKEGYCYASNNYLANLYGVNRSSITHWINMLIQAGYITQEFEYDDDHIRIIERKIYLTNKMPLVPQKPVQSNASETAAPAGGFGGAAGALKLDFEEKSNEGDEDAEGGGELFHQGGEISHQGGGELFHQGGEILQEELLHYINTNSAAADQKPENSDSEAAAAQLKQFFKNLDAALIFDGAFYPKALAHLDENGLDTDYVGWLYRYCLSKKPTHIANYYFKVFFEPRFIELYRESARPPPVTVLSCPVCGTEHDAALDMCPLCGLKAQDRNDPKSLELAKKLYAMPPDKKAAYEKEVDILFREPCFNGFLSRNFEEKMHRLNCLKEKYGLSDPPE